MALAVVVGAGCAALGWAHARAVARVTSTDMGALVIALKRLPQDERLPALSRRAKPGSFEHRVASEALAETDDRAKIAAVNDLLAEVEHALEARAGWPSAGIRIALFSAMLLGVIAYVAVHELRWALTIVAIGGASALACVEANRAAQRGAASQRRAIDDLVLAAMGDLGEAAPAAPERRSRRRGSRR